MKNLKKPIALILVILNGFSQLVPLAYAQQYNGVDTKPLEDQISSLYLKSGKNSIAGMPKLSLDSRDTLSSAHQRSPVSVDALDKADYKATEDITITITNPDDEPLQTKVTDVEGNEVSVDVEQTDTLLGTEVSLSASNQLKPGKYTIAITDSQGKTVKQDFSWGVLALNTDKSLYHPGETAKIAVGVLDDKGEMVCDAEVTLTIINQNSGSSDVLSTGNGKIKVNEDCSKYEFTIQPDFETNFQFQNSGIYTFQLNAKTHNGTHAIEESITVKEQIPFDVKRTSATRIYPPLKYPMQFEITANQDFEGTVTETVPAGFIITPGEDEKSYEKMNTLYMDDRTNPHSLLEDKVLGAQTSKLRMPFDGNFRISQGFGNELTDLLLRQFYSHYGLGGHDGIDFALPEGTPLYAVDDGNILVAGNGDYGVTVILQHSWGRSYYGHLSKTLVETQTNVQKGTLIGYSGNTGESTGPHLHFGIKPENPDMENGYLGKIDPLPYLPYNSNLLAENLSILSTEQKVLAASTSAEAVPTLDPEANKIQEDPLPKLSLSSAQPSFQVTDKDIKREVISDQPATVEKVKVISWNIKLKKGEKTKLSYSYKTPQVSPQYYLLGPLNFLENGEEVFAEKRQWQIAADAVGVGWYNNSWGARKQVTIDHTKVSGGSADAWCNDASGITCNTSWLSRKKITIDNSDSSVNLTDFPLLVKLNSGRIDYTDTQSDADDIRFVDPSDNTTVLPHEVEEFNESGDDYLWVKVPQIDAASTTDYIWMYYNNASATSGEDVTNVWDSTFKGVWHLNENPSITNCPTNKEVCDSTSSANNGDMSGSMTSGDQVTGQVDGSLDFDGSDDEIVVPHNANLNFANTANFTISFWTSSAAFHGTLYEGILEKDDASTRAGWEIFRDYNTNNIIMERRNSSGTFLSDCYVPFSAGTWKYVTFTYNGTDLSCYGNGSFVDSLGDTGNMGAPTTNMTMGYGMEDEWNGILDEVRISSDDRSADWIEAEYLTTTDAMNSFGTEESQGGSSLTDFPVLINLTTDAQIAAKAQADGDDILFTDSTGQLKLSHEIESYNSATGALVAWVKIPTLTSSTDTTIYMYYGNPSASSQQNATSVWNSNFKSVWHLREDPSGSAPQMFDSTSNNNDGTSAGTMTSGDQVAGQIDGSLDFDGSDDRISAADSSSLRPTNAITISAWIYPTSVAGLNVIMAKRRSGSLDSYHLALDSTGGQARFCLEPSGGAVCLITGGNTSADTWLHLTATWDGTTMRIYRDGAAAGSTASQTNTLDYASESVLLGVNDQNGFLNDWFNGLIDEARISDTALSSEWIATEYNNQNSPSTFYTLGAEESESYAATNDQLMRHGMFFDATGAEQPFLY